MKTKVAIWFVGVGHFLAFVTLLFVCGEQIERRLGRYTMPMLVGYAVFSLIFLLLLAKFLRDASRSKQVLATALVPYLSATLAYLFEFAVSGQLSSMLHKLGLFPVLFAAVVFPYLVMWGPLLSAIDVALLLLGLRVMSRRTRIAN